MLQTLLIILLSLLSTSCAAKELEARRLEHVCLFEMVEEICKEREGVFWFKISPREGELDVGTVKCYKKPRKEVRFTCKD